jgi:hypothetical protein
VEINMGKKIATAQTPAKVAKARKKIASSHGEGPSEDGPSEVEPSSSQINDEMLMAVASGDTWSLRRAIERGASIWLGGPECQSDDPLLNPALAALLSPFGAQCIEEFDSFFGDMRNWTHGRWNSAHWAVATKNEPVLAWALGGRSNKRWNGESGLSLLDAEQSSDSAIGGARRSALALAAQMGDPQWLRRVIEISAERGADAAYLAKRDTWGSVSSLGVALFELADGLRQGQSSKELAGREACVKILFEMGFSPDSSKAPAAKLCVALALPNPGQKALNKSMARAAKMALAMGSGAWEEQKPAGLYEAAGMALDLDWARALDLCGLSEPEDGSFALGASKRLLSDLRECSESGSWDWATKHKAGEVPERIAASLRAAPLPLSTSPLAGHEVQTALWMIESASGRDAAGVEQFKERIELAIASASSSGAALKSKKGPLRV